MARSVSPRRDEPVGVRHVVAHAHDDHFIKECDLKWENDLRRMCWSSNVPRDITDKIIEDHRGKQEKKKMLRAGDASREVEVIEIDDRDVYNATVEKERDFYVRERGSDQDTEAEKQVKPRSSTPTPAPARPSDIIAPVIVQEVITHHRHIDHGFQMPLRLKRAPEGRRAGDMHGDPNVNGDEQDATTEGNSSSRSSSTSRMPLPHVINAPTVRREVITNSRELALEDSKADRMVDLLETILLTLREEVRVTPLITAAGETDTKASKSMVEPQETAKQTSVPQKALPPPSKQKKPRRGKKQELEHA